MGMHQKKWARAKRAELKQRLGGKCVMCGSTEHLEFDCIIPQGDKHHRMDTSARMSFYNQQFKAGNLQLLCNHKAGSCHEKKTRQDVKDIQSGQVVIPVMDKPF